MGAADYLLSLQADLGRIVWPSTAVLVVDLQAALVGADPGHRLQGQPVSGHTLGADPVCSPHARNVHEVVVPAVTRVLSMGRREGALVVRAQLGSRGWPNSQFAPVARPLALKLWESAASESAKWLVPTDKSDVLIERLSVSAFVGTRLDLVLRVAKVDTVIVCGVSTDGAVASTARDAADLDYRSIVMADGCASWQEEHHSASLRHHARLFGPVIESDAILAGGMTS